MLHVSEVIKTNKRTLIEMKVRATLLKAGAYHVKAGDNYKAVALTVDAWAKEIMEVIDKLDVK